ncbi:hypothetical protein [Leucobacter sp. GX24907]
MKRTITPHAPTTTIHREPGPRVRGQQLTYDDRAWVAAIAQYSIRFREASPWIAAVARGYRRTTG